ncbi:MAG: ComF family protein [Bacteroidota bacterium]
MPVQNELFQRIKHTESQTRLSKLARRNNVEGAFALAQSIPVGIHHVGIVDDVITTGATLQQVVKSFAEHYPNLRITIFAAAIANH